MFELLERYQEGLAHIAEFLFNDLGIPFDIFALSFATLAIFLERKGMKAWWQHKTTKRNYRPSRPLSEWEKLEEHEQSLIRARIFWVIVMLVVGFVFLLGRLM
jgi:hypothetical protein